MQSINRIHRNIRFSAYNDGDEAQILELFQSAFKTKMRKDYWKWRFLKNVTGHQMIELAWDEERLVAQYAVSPVILTWAKKEVMSGISVSTMTHPEYRRQGLFYTLASSLYSRLEKSGYDLVWGFPNSNSHRAFVENLGWKDIYEIPTFRFETNSAYKLPNVSKNIVPLKDFDNRFDRLWDKVSNSTAIMVKRDQKYLRWRYNSNPLNDYKVLAYEEDNEIIGYCIYKYFNSDIDIVDILVLNGWQTAKKLITAVLNIACSASVTQGVNIWMPIHNELHLQLEKVGFCSCAPITYFGARILAEQKVQEEKQFTNYSHWFIQMGDSDVY